MNADFWKLKIAAFLHDPPNKALTLGRKDELRHEEFAKDLLKLLGIDSQYLDRIKEYDHLAAAIDRSLYNELKDKNGNKIKVSFVKSPYLVHPLSASCYNLGKYGELQRWEEYLKTEGESEVEDKIAKNAEDTVKIMVKIAIKNATRDNGDLDYKKLYFILWRLSNVILKGIEDERGFDEEKKKNRLGYLWNLLPADTRMPNHSVYLHNITTSAFVETGQHPAFFIFTIGPVQRFISQARKTSDLLSGSLILSYLTFESLKVVFDELGPDNIIFPDLLGTPLVDVYLENKFSIFSRFDVNIDENTRLPELKKKIRDEYDSAHSNLFIPTLPNRFFAILPENRAEDFAHMVEEAFIEAKNNLLNRAFQNIKEKFKNINKKADDDEKFEIDEEYLEQTFERQKSVAFEYYWVINYIDIPPSSSGKRDFYKIEYSNTESALGTRKRVREFEQVEEYGEKCTICGERSVLMPFKPEDRKQYRKVWKKLSEENRSFAKNEHEQLCIVGVLKRNFLKIYKDVLMEQYKVPRENIKEKYYRSPSVSQVAFSLFIRDFWEYLDKVNGKVEGFYEWLKNVSEINSVPGEDYYVNRVSDNIYKINLQKYGLGVENPLEIKLSGELYDPDGYDRLIGDVKKDNPELEKKVKETKKAYIGILKNLKRHGKITPPDKYYSVMLFDGDRMGKWLSGEFLKSIRFYLHPDVKENIKETEEITEKLNEKHKISPSIHRFISYALSQFSRKIVPKVINEHYGFLIYSGGDDVLALLPKRTTIDASFATYMLYSGRGVKDDGQKQDEKTGNEYKNNSEGHATDKNAFVVKLDKGREIKSQNSYVLLDTGELIPTMGNTATASCGIVIAHYITPLSLVLETARKAEKYAKDVLGRNAFAIYLMKRGGEHVLAGDKWLKIVDKGRVFPAILFLNLFSGLMDNTISEEELLKRIDSFLMFYGRTDEDKKMPKEALSGVNVSDSFVVELSEEFRGMLDALKNNNKEAEDEEDKEFKELLEYEMKRLLKRKISFKNRMEGETGNSKQVKNRIVDFLVEDGLLHLFEMPSGFEVKKHENPVIKNRYRFFNLLNIARFLARRSHDA